MVVVGIHQDLAFVNHFGRRNSVPATRYQVTFARGGVLDCSSEAEAKELTARHLARAAHAGVEDRVLGTVRLLRGPA